MSRRRSERCLARCGCAWTTDRRSSPVASPSSYLARLLSYSDRGDAFDHAAAVGFIEIFGLSLRVEAARHGAVGPRYGAAWSWTDPLLEGLSTSVTDPEAVPTG